MSWSAGCKSFWQRSRLLNEGKYDIFQVVFFIEESYCYHGVYDMNLGQIFTKDIVADYMASLFTIKDDTWVLDPCFGEGAFLYALQKTKKYHVVGYEIDKRLYNATKGKFPEYILKNADFLQIDNKKTYDGIIMNPPYVRHEKINDLSEFGVCKDVLNQNDIFEHLPATANLYMYFIIKAVSLLKQNGEIVVIFPESWLKARNGDGFSSALHRDCSIERRIHISGAVFEESAMVDVLILKLRKDGKNRTAPPEYIRLYDGKLEECEKKQVNIEINFHTPFSAIGKVRRGLTTGCNSMFINPDLSHGAGYTCPIISSPKQIEGFSTKGALFDELLVVNTENIEDTGIISFIADWEKKILKEGKPKTFVKKIKERKEWYKLNIFDCHGIIFSYFVRNDMKFVYNDTDKVIRDNFYVLYPEIDNWICFSLLNNLYTYYQLECVGKKYGAGLLKIQRYDIENLHFPNIKFFSDGDLYELKQLGIKLAETGNKVIIEDITQILSQYSNVSYEEIVSGYNDIVKNRLENV